MPKTAEHRPVVHRLRRRDRGVGIAHRRGGDGAAQDHEVGLHAEERRAPQHQVGALADLQRAQLVRHALGDGRIDGVLGDVALDAEVVVAGARPPSAGRAGAFILCAVCQVRMITSPTRPIAWLSEEIIESAPRSCRMSSAAMVSRRMRLSAKAMSSGMLASR